MPLNAQRPDEWNEIVDHLDAGNVDKAKELLVQRDRKLDAMFSHIDYPAYSPVLLQNGAAVTCDPAQSLVHGFRVGPWVQLNVYLKVTGTGTAGTAVNISLPAGLPFSTPSTGNHNSTVGSFMIGDASTGIHYTVVAVSLASSPTLVWGIPYGATAHIGAAGFTAALASGDHVSFAIQYRTPNPQ